MSTYAFNKLEKSYRKIEKNLEILCGLVYNKINIVIKSNWRRK
ncbi:MAG: hypothetical protein ACI4C7_06070 [Clostridia bacterium]